MLPRVKINFANGALGQVEAMADGCLGFLAIGAKEIEGDDNFKLGKAYTVKKLSALEALGVTEENNPNLYRNVKDFYAEAGDGAELWLMGFADTDTFATVLDKDNAEGAKSLLQASNGKLRGLLAFKTPADDYTVTADDGFDADVTAGMASAQGLGEWAADPLYGPIFSQMEGYGFTGDASKLKALTTTEYNRVGVVVGDTLPHSPNACMGIVGGRIAVSPVQRKISRVKDGALTPLVMYIGDRLVEIADVETIHEKGYITFTTFVGRTGYFIADDNLATRVEDDYRSLTNRRVIDKAYRVAYNTLLDSLNDEVPIATDGTLSPAWCASVKSNVERAIVSNMTANGNLGNDPGDTNDTGVECSIDYAQNILATSHLAVGLRVKPNGYAKYIDVELGFKTE